MTPPGKSGSALPGGVRVNPREGNVGLPGGVAKAYAAFGTNNLIAAHKDL